MREAPTIVLIGAGSTSFGLSTLHDLYADPVFTGATVWLVDVDGAPARADAAARGGARVGDRARHHGARRRPTGPMRSPARTRSSCPSRWIETGAGSRTSRFRAATVSSTCSVRTPVRAGSRTRCARSRSLPGSRATSSGWRPTRCSINFTNPEGRICTAFRRHLDQPIVGLCHEVELAQRRFSSLLGRTIECRAAGLNHLTALVAARDATTGEDVTAELHRAVTALDDRDGETYAFVRYLHDRFGVVIATSDSHAGEYYREAVEHAAPKDFLARQVRLRKVVDGAADAIIAGKATSSVPAVGDQRTAPPDPARGDQRRAGTHRVGDPAQRRPRSRAARRLRGRSERGRERRGDHGRPNRRSPARVRATLRHEVAIQQLVADAAMLGSRDAALQALLVDPVVGSSRAAEGILADFETAHGDLWPALA